MVERFTSNPIELPPPGHELDRVDLIFYGIDHSGESYAARVYLDARGVGGDPGPDHRAYVGTFFIFGHGGCFGDVGHCDLPGERDPFDIRPPHQLEPATRVLTVTGAVRALLERGVEAAKATVVAETEGRASNQVLSFDRVRLATYA
jgi:hypothetical protein